MSSFPPLPDSSTAGLPARLLRERAEALFEQRAAAQPAAVAPLPPEALRALLHELQVHQIELEMQNEELRRAQLELGASRARYFDLYDRAPVGYCTVSALGLVLQANLAAAALVGSTRGALVGQPVSRLFSKEDQDVYYRLCKLLQASGQPQSGELRLAGPDGSTCWGHLDVDRLPQDDGQDGLRIVISDVTRQRQDADEIRRLAFVDELTGLPNRRLLMDRLRHAVVTAARAGQCGALLFLDLDDFKQLNDSLGHSAGDELLVQVALRLQARLREGDSVARLGGDEFVVLLEGLNQQTAVAAMQANDITLHLLAALRQPYSLRGRSHGCTPSIGVTLFTSGHETLDELLGEADSAMYRAKAAGRNHICFYDPAVQAAVAARKPN